mmetsp:Transcript_6827/g.13020  ORF Transcript_6827/g.13020 Transcript_6827/m.13020 type:complete len:311 (-) Transcript_6827:47-979(-)
MLSHPAGAQAKLCAMASRQVPDMEVLAVEESPSREVWAATVDEVAEALDAVVLPLLADKHRCSGSKTFHCILEAWLYLGGGEVSADDLRAVGITHVVRVLEGTSHRVLPETELGGVFSIQVADVQNSDLRPFFPKMRSFVQDARKKGGKVYVHCAQGRSRSCTMVLSYLIYEESMSLRAAFAHVLQRRDVSAINLGFLAQLIDLDEAVNGKQSLPLLSAFIAKSRWNQNVLQDTSRKFDAFEFLELWRDPSAKTRDPNLALATLRACIVSLRRLVEGGSAADVDPFIEPLHTKCCTELSNQLYVLSAVQA